MLVGSPRSGTTWLQSILGAHPEVATPQETDLFRVFLQPLVEAWDRQRAGATDVSESRRRKGLPLAITEAEFTAAAGTLVRTMTDAVVRMKPTATVVVEKSPAHSLSVETVLRFAPDAGFVHIVRDGRDVAESLMAASADGWGSRWAPDSVARAARVWEQHVRGARTAAGASGGYFELQYESLLGPDAPGLVTQAFAVCGISVDASEAATLVREHSLDAMRDRGRVSDSILTGGEAGDSDLARGEPAGFFRRGGTGGWRASWNTSDRQTFAAVAGDLLTELGYEPDDRWVGRRIHPGLPRRAAHRFANRGAALLRGAAERLERLPVRRRR
jgi:hypothetical protein